MKTTRLIGTFALALFGLLLHTPASHAQRTAIAAPVVYASTVIAVIVVDGGAGYETAPAVTITGGGGSGATAVATVTGGVVSRIDMLAYGSGYTGFPTVVVAAPPTTTLSLQMAPVLTLSGSPGRVVQVQWADVLNTNSWHLVTNVVLGSGPLVWCDFGATQAYRRFYRAVAITNVTQLNWLQQIPPGSFTMGSADTEQDHAVTESLQTQVTLTYGFYIAKHEVTQGEYLAMMGSNPSSFTGDTNRPVETVSWINATNYCAKLTAWALASGLLPQGWSFRLPTEAEWEYACRAGTTTRFSFGDDPSYSLIGQYAWYNANSGGTTHPVGTKLPNPWGLYDMHGGVYEWVHDWWSSNHPGGSVTNSTGPATGSQRVVRGGVWRDRAADSRSATRGYGPASYTGSETGFRVVLAPN